MTDEDRGRQWWKEPYKGRWRILAWLREPLEDEITSPARIVCDGLTEAQADYFLADHAQEPTRG